MLIMWELDHELTQVLSLLDLVCLVRLAECKARICAWRGTSVTDNADCRTRPNHRLPRKELGAMTANAGIVSRKIGDVGKVAPGCPRGRNLVASIASETLMLF
jgi:hypothetical protein